MLFCPESAHFGPILETKAAYIGGLDWRDPATSFAQSAPALLRVGS
jgi:hypothetical protein